MLQQAALVKVAATAALIATTTATAPVTQTTVTTTTVTITITVTATAMATVLNTKERSPPSIHSPRKQRREDKKHQYEY